MTRREGDSPGNQSTHRFKRRLAVAAMVAATAGGAVGILDSDHREQRHANPPSKSKRQQEERDALMQALNQVLESLKVGEEYHCRVSQLKTHLWQSIDEARNAHRWEEENRFQRIRESMGILDGWNDIEGPHIGQWTIAAREMEENARGVLADLQSGKESGIKLARYFDANSRPPEGIGPLSVRSSSGSPWERVFSPDLYARAYAATYDGDAEEIKAEEERRLKVAESALRDAIQRVAVLLPRHPGVREHAAHR